MESAIIQYVIVGLMLLGCAWFIGKRLYRRYSNCPDKKGKACDSCDIDCPFKSKEMRD